MTLPNFLVIGSQRSGTTWLDQQLRTHPNIYLPTIRKEVHFFDRYYDRGLDWYERFFPTDSESNQYKWIGEITPKYIFDPSVPKLIYKEIPDCKLILILRNPVDRLYSQYGHSIRNQNYQESFETFIQNPATFTRSLYAEQVKRYLQYFSSDQLLVLIFEETIKQPEFSLSRIAQFLEIDESKFAKIDKDKKVNSSYYPRFSNLYKIVRNYAKWLKKNDLDWVFNTAKFLGFKKELFGVGKPIPKLNYDLRNSLLLKYEESIIELEEILGRDLSIWRG